MNKAKQYIDIVQALLEPGKCEIGKTNNLDRHLNEYNQMTGISKDNIYQYLFTCEVKDMALLEKGYEIIQDKRYTPYINGKECFQWCWC